MSKYHKRIGLSNFKHNGKDILRLENIIYRLGYNSKDFKINYFKNTAELIITNQNLHRDLKVIRATEYEKS